MAIGRTFEEALQKAIRAVDTAYNGFERNTFKMGTNEELSSPDDQRLFALANALHDGISIEQAWNLTKIDKWFLERLRGLVELDKFASSIGLKYFTISLLLELKRHGFADKQIARMAATSELAIRQLRSDLNIRPFVKQIDTVAAEFPCSTNYLYMTYNAQDDDLKFEDKGVIVLGSGVYRIGSSVEFDWCGVRAVRTLRSLGFQTIMINYNPETVSTDYDEADRLYFENIDLERVLDIYELEQSTGVVISMGGQTANNIALALHRQKVKIFGTLPEQIDNAENRYKFSRLLDKIGVDQPEWKELTSLDDAKLFCAKVDFPVLVRPSYVLSGAAMNVVYSVEDLDNYLGQAAAVSKEHPVVITKYIEEAKEIEVDAVAEEGELVMHVISEHVENAGVHSGDATLILPPQDLDPETVFKVEQATCKIANMLKVTGPFNIQFIAKNNQIKVIECNLRASRSFPFASKVGGVDLIEMATKVIMGVPVEPYPKTIDKVKRVAVKVPQFSFNRLTGADPVLGVEMASTGEVACFGKDKYEAYIKALLATYFKLPNKNILISIGSYKEKLEFLPSVRKLHQLGYDIFATPGTADFMSEHQVHVTFLDLIDTEDERKKQYSIAKYISEKRIDLYINLPSKNRYRRPASYMSRGYRTRRLAIDQSIPLITNIKCAKLFVEALARMDDLPVSHIDCISSHKIIRLPGFIDLQAYIPDLSSDTAIKKYTRAALANGFTAVCFSPSSPSSPCDSSSFGDLERLAFSASACDFGLPLVASHDNEKSIASSLSNAVYLAINVHALKGDIQSLRAHFLSHSGEIPIVVRAQGTELASVLFLASLYDKAVHVTHVMSNTDIELIRSAKEKGIHITCDVAIHNLFYSCKNAEIPGIGSAEDVENLWTHMNVIDCLVTGDVPFILEKGINCGDCLDEAIPLLLTAVAEGRLSLEDLVNKLYRNPKTIFNLRIPSDACIEVDVERECLSRLSRTALTPVFTHLRGCIERLVLRHETVYLNGRYFPSNSVPWNIKEARSMDSPVKSNVVKPEVDLSSPSAISSHPLPGNSISFIDKTASNKSTIQPAS